MAAPTLDGHATKATPDNAAHASGVVTLTTTLTNDVIVLVVFNEGVTATSTANHTVSTIASANLAAGVWTKYAQGNTTVGNTSDLEIWWARSAAALTAEAITVTFTGNVDGYGIVAFGVHGCVASPTSPWDPNASLPAIQHLTVSGTPSQTISTTNANNFLLAALGNPENTPLELVAPAGWAMIDSVAEGVSFQLAAEAAAASLGVTATQTSLAVTWGHAVTTQQAGAYYIVAALTADTGGNAGPFDVFPHPPRYRPDPTTEDDELPGRERRKAAAVVPDNLIVNFYSSIQVPQPARYRPRVAEEYEREPSRERRKLTPRIPVVRTAWLPRPPRYRPDVREEIDDTLGRVRRRATPGIPVQLPPTTWLQKLYRARPPQEDDDERPGRPKRQAGWMALFERGNDNVIWFPQPRRLRQLDEQDDTLGPVRRRIGLLVPASNHSWLPRPLRARPSGAEEDERVGPTRRGRVIPVAVISGSVFAPGQLVSIRQTTPTAVNVFLPTAPTPGKPYIIKDTLGVTSLARVFTVRTLDGTLIDGAATFPINSAFATIFLTFDGIGWILL